MFIYIPSMKTKNLVLIILFYNVYFVHLCVGTRTFFYEGLAKNCGNPINT